MFSTRASTLSPSSKNYIESTPDLLGEDLLIVARQERTTFGGFIDLLAMDETGAVHIIELKRDKTPRDVAAQILDYAAWVSTLGRADIQDIFERYSGGEQLEAAFAGRFNDQLPDEVNASQVFTIVATELDSATERIVRYLNEAFGVPINAVFSNHFVEESASYLARSWLVEPESQEGATSASRGRAAKTREPWNGTDWYVAIGDAERFDRAVVSLNEMPVKLANAELEGNYRHENDELDENAEWIVPVEWIRTVPLDDGLWEVGMFANQNTAARLRQQFTIEKLVERFNLNSENNGQAL